MVSIHSFAQEPNLKKNEIGINLLNLYVVGPNSDPANHGDAVAVNYLTGLMYKHYWGQNVLRIGADYNYSFSEYYDYPYVYVSPTLEKSRYTNTFFKLEGRIGFARFYRVGKFQHFIGIDGLIGYDLIERTGYDYPDYPSDNYYYSFTNSYLRYGISPITGVQYFITSRFSTTIELSLNIVGTTNLQQDKFKNTKGVTFEFFPIRLFSVNYHF